MANKTYDFFGTKLQQEIVKKTVKATTMGKPDHSVHFQFTEFDVYVTFDGYVCYKIPRKFFAIDKKILETVFNCNADLSRFFARPDTEPNAVYFYTRPVDKVGDVCKLEADGFNTYFNAKLFNQFIGADFTYHSQGKLSTTTVFYNGTAVAIVSPMRIAEEF